MKRPELFTPIDIGGITLPNRVVISPMCQYSADDGSFTDWHMVHLGHLAYSGAGLMILEATHVTREGRITPKCAGLYDERNEATISRVIEFCRKTRKEPIGIQLAHAGRKASSQVPWEGREWLRPGQGPWETIAPSPIPYGEGWHTPREMDKKDLQATIDAFVESAQRAKRIGFDLVELHSAHGYLLHQFLSPLSNQRKDIYGKERMKFPLEVSQAVREVWPKERALGARITANDWMPGGFGVDDAVVYARELQKLGFDYVCISTGALVPQARIPVTPGYQVPFAQKIKSSTTIKVQTVGMIADADQAQEIVASGKADMVTMARAFLDNPRWVWHAAEHFGVELPYPSQYQRSRHDLWPGSTLARPPGTKAAA